MDRPSICGYGDRDDETNHLLDFFPILLTDFPGFGIKTISPYFKGQPYPAKSSSKSPRVMSDNILPDPPGGAFRETTLIMTHNSGPGRPNRQKSGTIAG